jgi:tetratricopeptide (TPR) repeat protein
LAVGLTLTGCAALVVPPQAAFSLPEAARQYNYLKDKVLPPEPQVPNDQRLAKLGATALANGDLNRAEINLDAALVINPYNAHALYYLGVIYQRTSRYAEARTLYTRLIALDSPATATVDGAGANVGERLVHLARMNFIEMGRAHVPDAAPPPERGDAERAIASRFATVMRLRDQNLITKEEYAARRRANLGALLPMTEPPPPPGLAQPAPSATDVIVRLDAISRFKDAGAVTESEYATERAAILDGLLPAQPGTLARVAAAPSPPENPEPDLDRLDRLFAMKLITAEERNREHAALVAASAPVASAAPSRGAGAPPATPPATSKAAVAAPATTPPAGSGASARAIFRARKIDASRPAADGKEKTATETAASTDTMAASGAIGVHIASFRTPERAKRSWDDLRKANGDVLSSLDSRIARVDLGNNGGVFFQLRAGPVADADAAKALCSELKRRKLYCAPTAF